jgi:hypothetical protein
MGMEPAMEDVLYIIAIFSIFLVISLISNGVEKL